MVEPAHVGRAALVALGVDALLGLGRRRHHRAALAGGELLVGIEGEHRQVAPRAHRGAVGVRAAERLAGVLHEPQRAVGGEPLEGRHVGRVSEDVHRQQPGRAVGHRVGRGLRGDVERARVDVAEHGPGALVEQAVRGGHEAERRRDNVVARAPHPPRGSPGGGRRCPRRRRRRARRPGGSRRRTRTRRASAPGRAGRSGASRGRVPLRARRSSGRASGITSLT